jgi:hypothetical protein
MFPALSIGTENPRLFVSILSCEVPTGDQLAADATDGTTKAHNANTTPHSNTLFFEIILNILNTPRQFRWTSGSNAAPDRRHANEALQAAQ